MLFLLITRPMILIRHQSIILDGTILFCFATSSNMKLLDSHRRYAIAAAVWNIKLHSQSTFIAPHLLIVGIIEFKICTDISSSVGTSRTSRFLTFSRTFYTKIVRMLMWKSFFCIGKIHLSKRQEECAIHNQNFIWIDISYANFLSHPHPPISLSKIW